MSHSNLKIPIISPPLFTYSIDNKGIMENSRGNFVFPRGSLIDNLFYVDKYF